MTAIQFNTTAYPSPQFLVQWSTQRLIVGEWGMFVMILITDWLARPHVWCLVLKLFVLHYCYCCSYIIVNCKKKDVLLSWLFSISIFIVILFSIIFIIVIIWLWVVTFGYVVFGAPPVRATVYHCWRWQATHLAWFPGAHHHLLWWQLTLIGCKSNNKSCYLIDMMDRLL